jgi:dipeptidyl aminopeptidase/acylaminoacyl peptidase
MKGIEEPKSNEYIAFTIQSVTEQPNIYVSKLSPSKPVKLTDSNLQPKDVARSNVEIHKWRNKDEKWDIHGILVKPLDYQPIKKYPLLAFLEGGPSMLRTRYNFNAQYLILALAAKEYLILAPNTREHYGYGYDCNHAILCEKNYGPGPFSDMISGVNLMIEKT